MEVVRIYPAAANGGRDSIRTRKNLSAARVDTYEEWPTDVDYTLVTANNESFVIDEDFNSFDKRLKAEKVTDY